MRKIALAFVMLAGVSVNANAQTRMYYGGNNGYLGIRFEETTTVDGKGRVDHVTIAGVSGGSPAEKAGLKAGDEILRVNGLAASNGKFMMLARTLEPGDTVKLRIKRSNNERDFTVIAGKRPAEQFTIRINADSVRKLTRIFMDSAMVHLDSMNLPNITIMKGDSGFDFKVMTLPKDSMFFKRDSTVMRLFRERSGDRFPMLPPETWNVETGPGMIFRSVELGNRSIAGAELAEVDPAMVDVLKTDKGLLVLRVAPETPADRAGLQPGDVIIRAKTREVRKVEDLRAIVRANPDGIKLDVLRKGATRSIELKTGGR